MTLNPDKRSRILISVFLVLLVLSLSLYFFTDNVLVRRVLFFPARTGYSGEMRRIPRQGTVEDDVELLVKELILGPYKIDHLRAVPENTKLQNLLIRNRSSLYVDFSAALIVSDDDFGLSPLMMTELIRRNVIYNFPFLEEITLSVDGQTL